MLAGANVFEHGLGSGEKVGVSNVVDDLGGSDARGENEGPSAAAVLLVGFGQCDELFRGGAECGKRAVAEDKRAATVELGLGDALAGEREVQGCDHAPRDRFAVQ